ncbi:hypothetical protein [Tropicibacter oceani]|uniref:Uncharacterized protein n=1 Tax=Tropicibacter oceani TaxID=3058420 RepID=A0ABY8QJA8_9RHOB|nr:hypothetical protein [Tropicibacter oceani]WGW04695.1 hypothetical protein QF118_03850 [Tropicibacter oceani]
MTIRTVLIGVPAMLLGWIVTLVLVALLSDAAPAYAVLFPDGAFLGALPRDVSILASSDFSVTVTSDSPGLAATLYRQGALVVLPAGLRGCLPMPRP